MYLLCVILIVLASVLMCGIVLIQNSKGGGLAAGFASSNQIMGVRKTTDFLEKATWSLAALMVVISVIAAYALPKETAIMDVNPTKIESIVDAPVVEAPVAESLFEDIAPIVAPVVEPVVEPVVAAPVDEVVDLLAEEEEAPKPASRPVLSKHQNRGFQTLEETPIEELMEKDKQTLMENSEALHTVDAKDPAAKREFDSIMDFFNEL